MSGNHLETTISARISNDDDCIDYFQMVKHDYFQMVKHGAYILYICKVDSKNNGVL